MCYSNSLTSKNVDLSKKYKKEIPSEIAEEPLFHASGFSFPEWRVVTKEPHISVMNWGLIPHWFTGGNWTEIASKTLNARSETVLEKASFKQLIGRNHCIIPSTGFFEYQTRGKEKVPYFVYPKKDKLFSMAGIYDEHLDTKTGEKKYSFSIITSEANEFMSEIHNSKKRMPIMLNDEQIDGWLHASENEVKQFFEKTPNELFAGHTIDPKLLKSANRNTPEIQQEFIITRFEQGSLF
jgi:putative SOS response-associated peptidase YedK|tara:strand:+ start:847 stop:1560 length:714 start_codon:yes stop_codon:yes gene_type:complete